MKKIFSFIFCVLVAGSTFGQSNSIVGTWLTSDKSAHIEIYESNNQFLGKIVWLKEPNNPRTGKPWLDEQNEIPAKKLKPLMGSVVLWDFYYNHGEYIGGKVYDGRDGKTYEGKIWLTDKNTLKMRGYLGIFFKTETWLRIR